MPSIETWLKKVAPMSVSTTNGALDLVVLVVEDEFLVRCSIAERLREAGYRAVEAVSGEEAIAVAESAMSIDIVFTDINLSGAASGWDVAEFFRRNRPNAPVIYTSGKLADPQRRVPGSVFLPKPYKCTEVLAACQQLTAAA
jgi:CheY-like chemotaxis protein